MQFKLKDNHLLNNIHEWVRLQNFELNQNLVEDIKIALGEVLQNIIRHGYKNNLNEEDFIEIEFKNNNEGLAFIVRDYAEPCNPDSFLNKNFIPNESGHMGISIIRKLTNEFTIKPLQDGNETKLVFRIV
jgi:anti-sigma regulatory factor (Ser/Thr protein kinase)